MKYTLSDCITTINQVLNYPSVEYADVAPYFDQAISELNTELHIGLKPISEIYKKTTFDIGNLPDAIMLSSPPDNNPIPNTNSDGTNKVWYSDDNLEDSTPGEIHYEVSGTTRVTKHLYGIYAKYENGNIVREIYHTVILTGHVYWTPYAYVPEKEIDLIEYLPFDWITLYLIPYICFKYSVRDGSSGAHFLEDMQQGYQQLQKSYDIPCFVTLSKYADRPAYKSDVVDNLPKLNISIPTRAIYDDMKIDRVVASQFTGLYDNGGW